MAGGWLVVKEERRKEPPTTKKLGAGAGAGAALLMIRPPVSVSHQGVFATCKSFAEKMASLSNAFMSYYIFMRVFCILYSLLLSSHLSPAALPGCFSPFEHRN